MKAIVFIDAENISSDESVAANKKKIKRFAKNYGFTVTQWRAYAVENGPTYSSWNSEGVRMIPIAGDPAKDKADNQIYKEVEDQLDKGNIVMVVTNDNGLRKRLEDLAGDTVYLFPKIQKS